MTTFTSPSYIANLTMSKVRSLPTCVNYNYWMEYLLNSLSGIDATGLLDLS